MKKSHKKRCVCHQPIAKESPERLATCARWHHIKQEVGFEGLSDHGWKMMIYLLFYLSPSVIQHETQITLFEPVARPQQARSPVLPCLFQRCPLIESEVTALREILEEVGVISTWILRAPSLLLLFKAAPCSVDLMALPTCNQTEAQRHLLYCNIFIYTLSPLGIW